MSNVKGLVRNKRLELGLDQPGCKNRSQINPNLEGAILKTTLSPQILCIVVSISDCQKTLKSIKSQTVKPAKIVVSDKKYPHKFTGERAGMAMREALSKENLDEFTHILRVDGDVILQPYLIEYSLSLNVDLVGNGGYFQLFKVKMFKELFECTYPVDFAEDTCLSLAVKLSRRHSSEQGIKPILPPARKYPKSSWIEYGACRYRLGYSLFKTLACFRNHRSKTFVGFNAIFAIAGFMRAVVQRPEKCWFVKT